MRLLKLNADEAPDLSAHLDIRSIPTLLLVRGEKILARASGVMSADQIVAWTRSKLSEVGARCELRGRV